MKEEKRVECLSQGKPSTVAKSLYPIVSMCNATGEGASLDFTVWANLVQTESDAKWSTLSKDSHEAFVQSLAFNETTQAMPINSNDLEQAASKVKKPYANDSYGISVAGLWCFFAACSQLAVRIFNELVHSRQLVSSLAIRGFIKAKQRGTISASETRVLLPLPAVLQVLDVLISARLSSWIATTYSESLLHFEVHRTRRQSADAFFAIRQFVEKALDNHSRGCILEADIMRFYDSIPPHCLVALLINKGFCLVAAMFLFWVHSLVPIQVNLTDHDVAISSCRACGVLTGSRTAGVLARLPLLECFLQLHHELEPLVMNFDGLSMCAISFVDNVWLPHTNVETVLRIFHRIQTYLKSVWRLSFKPKSIKLMPVKWYPEPYVSPYLVVEQLSVLGVIVSNNNSSTPDIIDMKRRAWAAFWRSSLTSLRKLPVRKQIRWLHSCVFSTFAFKLTSWPYSKNTAKIFDSLQSHMISILVNTFPYKGEDHQAFYAKRRRASSRIATTFGRWSQHWAHRIRCWHKHLLRSNDDMYLPSRVFTIRDAKFLNECRAKKLLLSSTGTSTRAPEAKNVQLRWEDGLSNCAGIESIPKRPSPLDIIKCWSHLAPT